MGERVLPGLPAAPGVAAGRARMPARVVAASAPVADRPAELERARHALALAGEELAALADRLRAAGRPGEADVVDTGVLMAGDPALEAPLEAAIMGDGLDAPTALVRACGVHADAIAALGDPTLALRADDVRSLGRRAAALATGRHARGRDVAPGAEDAPGGHESPGGHDARGRGNTPDGEDAPGGHESPGGHDARGRGNAPRGHESPGGGDSRAAAVVLVAEDLGPADVAELPAGVVAIALAAGGPSAHAAVIARGLGIPMVVGVGPTLLDVPDGAALLVDGDRGEVVVEPARAAPRRRRELVAHGPARTRDRRRIRVLANAAGPADVRIALASGAEGVGLLRTELAFLDAERWPDEDDHRAALGPVLSGLGGRTATVRVLDFGGDKTPPFLAGIEERGIALLLSAPDALAAQLRAITAAGAATDLRILLPLVRGPEDVEAVRAMAPGAVLGAMLETAGAIAAADAIAAAADFLSIGTNDLTADLLGADRFAPGAAVAHDPRVLRAIARAGEAAATHGRVLEVCGEAASDPRMIPLLIGLGVTELSVGAARVGETWMHVARTDARAARALALRAADAADAGAVERLLGQAGEAAGEGRDGARSVVAVGPQP